MDAFDDFTRAEILAAMTLTRSRREAERHVEEFFRAVREAGDAGLAVDVGLYVALTFVNPSCAERARDRLADVLPEARASADRLSEQLAELLGRPPFS